MHDIEIEFDVPVPMRDGTTLRADIYRPTGDGSFPVLVSRTPYGKEILRDTLLDFKSMVRSGYIVVQQDTRGRFASEGEWTPWKHERLDGYDTIEWAAALPQSNGKVGMFGGSYLASTQWSAAIAGAPHLVALAPAITWADPEDGLMFRGGAIELGLCAWFGLGQAMGQYPKEIADIGAMMSKMMATMADFDSLAGSGYWELPAGALPAVARSGQPDTGVTRALADPATIDESRVSTHYEDVDLPTLNFAGWYDVFQQGSLDNYIGMRALGRTTRLIVGPYAHTTMYWAWSGGQVGEVNFGTMAQLPGGRSYTDIQREWYDHWLKDLPATSAHESGVLLFTMGSNQWRSEPEWPLTRARATALHLGPDSTLSWEPAAEDSGSVSEFVYDPADPVITRGGNLTFASEFPAGPLDQRDVEARDDVLVFSTPPLETDIEITGRVQARLFASTDGPSTDWVVRLCEVDSEGVSRNIVDGITRVRTEPSRIDEVEIDLWSTSILVRAGHRLRVQVTSSCFPRWDRNLNTGEPETEGTAMRVARQHIFHDRDHPSHIIVPIVAD